MNRISILLSGIVFSVGILPAQQVFLSGPTEGFTFDVPTRSFRAVIGFLGSASFGSPILDELDYGSVAPYQNFAIAFKGGQCLFVTGLGSNQVSTSVIPNIIAQPEGIVWSGNGSLAILYSRTGNWIQTLANLPGAVNPSAPIDLSLLGGPLRIVATDFSGRNIALAIGGATAGFVYLMADGQGFAPVLQISKPIALAFADDGQQLYALDRDTLQVTQLGIADLNSQSFALESVEDPVAIKSARDATNRQVLYVAGRTDQLLQAYDLSSFQLLASASLDFLPSCIDGFGHTSFVLAPRLKDGDPLWLFRNSPQPAIYFVPAAPPTLGGSQ